MSEANVQIVRRLVEHYLATDELPGELFAPTFVWDLSTFRDWPEQRLYEGLDGLRALLETGRQSSMGGCSSSTPSMTRVRRS
jgi:hypothetical protein